MKNKQNVSKYRRKIGENIAKYRKQRNLSQKQLAELVGIAPQTLSCIETGINNPLFNVMIEIAIVLEIPLAHFFIFDDLTYNVADKELLFLASEAFNGLDYKQRQLAFKLLKCLKESG